MVKILNLLLALWIFLLPSLGSTASNGGLPSLNPLGTTSSTDHSKLKILEGPFENGPDVTRACLTCHTESARHVMTTKHWTWRYVNQATGELLGKREVLNSFCGSPRTNWVVCSDCHVGYGWKPNGSPINAEEYDYTVEENVDCLVCHDTTGEYHKNPEDGAQVFDLVEVAMNVGRTSRKTCGNCHFFGGGGDGVKHGDLDSSLFSPSRSLDIHMHANGLDFSCSTCHTTDGHQITGSRYTAKATDHMGVDIPGRSDLTRTSCESCHGFRPHAHTPRMNDHTDRIACPTCHIPFLARGGKKTKTWWDWSTATKLDENGKPFKTKDADGYETYTSQKGDFRWEANVVPEYFWFNGSSQYTLPKDRAPGIRPVKVNRILGSHEDPASRIWPFKVMRGKQAFDPTNRRFLVVHTAGDDDSALWSNFDFDNAIHAGMASLKGVSYSGKYDFVETEMYWLAAHMVAPAEEALSCVDCHSRQGRLANLSGFYIPGRDRFPLLDQVGWILVVLVSIGVIGHAGLRFYFSRKEG
ncbi:tetrathionate reductase family octaheme c-type cytochrome [Magnetococcales bacterium HHB-1]